MCSISQECVGSPIVTDAMQCPTHQIDSFTPSSGPPSGGTIITITGTNLGVRFEDFADNSIMIGGVVCSPLSMGYESGRRIRCQIMDSLPEGAHRLKVTLDRLVEGVLMTISVLAMDDFTVVRPTLSSVDPVFGPIAGGSELRIRGIGLDIGSSVTVTLDRDGAAGMCQVM